MPRLSLRCAHGDDWTAPECFLSGGSLGRSSSLSRQGDPRGPTQMAVRAQLAPLWKPPPLDVLAS